ncbi:DUF6920 family protein [Saccharospirillum salsuginis]|uniref:Uncharacterized protein n=1 Tax=Saccharospirillum salsuginis TaxID=418750 RepID=A0A918K604_9GAMM|nr:DUF6544 family protein [Saccharospirillum salsuginis]GGX48950.1 hypothetical protein GCM10007392_15220 [Saccharospirillum salsuginis]
MPWKILIITLLSLIALVVLVAVSGHWRWSAETRSILSRLDDAHRPLTDATVDFSAFDDLPAPVRAYFRRALTDGQPLIDRVSLRQSGTFNQSETGQQWQPFTANQVVTAQRPGFDWHARIRMLPGAPIRVHDAYLSGEGVLHASLLGWISPVNLRGGGDIAEGELMRWLAEAAWNPTVLLPGQGVQWTAIDDRSARATLVDGDVRVSLVFRFNDDNLIESVRADARVRTLGEQSVPTPWEGRWFKYEKRDGMWIPTEGEVAWLLDAGEQTYWRGRIERVDYQFVQP